MPIRRRADFFLQGKPFMLLRDENTGRAWHRTGQPDAPNQRSSVDVEYGNVPSELDHPEVWNDWSGGMGVAYRETGDNTYHWAENFDARFPYQLVHCQRPLTVKDTYTLTDIVMTPVDGIEKCDEIVDSTMFAEPPKGGLIALFGRGGLMAMTPYNNQVLVGIAGANLDGALGSPYYLHPAAVWGSYMYMGTSSPSYYSALSSSFNIVDIPSDGYRVVQAGNRLWRAMGVDQRRAFYLQSIAVTTMSLQGSGGNWSATLNIGNQNFGIKDLIAVEDQVVAGLPNGLYVGDQSGTFVNVLGEFEKNVSDDNCRDLCLYDGAVIVPYAAGLYAYRSAGINSQIEQITPPQSARSPIQGRVRSVRGYGRWLYGGLYTGSQSWLVCGQNQTEDGSWVWHTLQRFAHSMKPSRMHVDGLTVATHGGLLPHRFWLAADASLDTGGTAPVYWWCIPSNDGNPLAPSTGFSANYVGSARIDFGSTDWGAPTTPKVYRSVEVWANNMASGYQWCDVYYTVDEGTRTKLGTVTLSPKQTLYFPTESTASFVTGQSIQLSLESFTKSGGITPLYRSVLLRGALRPRAIEQIAAVVRIADNIRDRNKALMRSGATMISELRTMAESAAPVELIDLAGATQWVDVLAPVEEQEYYQQGSKEPEILATVRMSVLKYSGS